MKHGFQQLSAAPCKHCREPQIQTSLTERIKQLLTVSGHGLIHHSPNQFAVGMLNLSAYSISDDSVRQEDVTALERILNPAVQGDGAMRRLAQLDLSSRKS